MTQKKNITVGFSANLAHFYFTGDSNSEKKKVNERKKNVVEGTSVNFGLQAQELGATVHMVTFIGKDSDGVIVEEFLKSKFERFTPIYALEETPEAVIAIHTDQGHRRSLLSYKPENNVLSGDVDYNIDIYRYYPTDAVVMTGVTRRDYRLVSRAFEDKSDTLAVLNPRSDLVADYPNFIELLHLTDVVCMNEEEFEVFRKHNSKRGTVDIEDLDDLHFHGPSIVIVTLGDKGAMVSADGLKKFIPVRDCGKAIDPTGAGDAFLSAFVTRYLDGSDVVSAAEFGSLVAGIAVTKVGGSNTVTAAELAEFSEKEKEMTQFDPKNFEHGTYVGGTLGTPAPSDLSCPVCTRDLILVGNAYVCSSVMNSMRAVTDAVDDDPCEFSYPAEWPHGDPRIAELAEQRRTFLVSLKQEVPA